ncbi:ester cyclase [Streptomyces sp. GbtcB6]|uniref:ester cyclase n=1 Tax=Streptomyces sp. GbtcB6 TaxID=2824751 RepID=UPI001C302C08|nr:ester cyclase [Streptomyces sp. GbtcB6]
MTFVQLIECRTRRFDEMDRLMDRWVEQTKGKRTATHTLVGKDRTDAQHVVEIVEFPSYEEAMRNSRLPETDKVFHELLALCEGTPTFTDLDVVRDQGLYADTARRFFDTIAAAGPLAPLDGLLAEDYHDHDPVEGQDTIGMDAMRRKLEMWRRAFDFSFLVEDQIAQGDRVCTRWLWTGVQKAEFMGVPNTGRQVTMAGTTVHRFDAGGKMAEGWLQYDRMGLLAQLGALDALEN